MSSPETDLARLTNSVVSSRKDEIISRLEERNQLLEDRCNERTLLLIFVIVIEAMGVCFYFLPAIGASLVFLLLLSGLLVAANRLGFEELQEMLVWCKKLIKDR